MVSLIQLLLEPPRPGVLGRAEACELAWAPTGLQHAGVLGGPPGKRGSHQVKDRANLAAETFGSERR